ncbi:hypothetical protein [Sphingomonas sp.]|jgi:hypothetical protein|uniref:hypothetical protein n=1 Tax=Sphingomonas sp. TaxID=28214 RepID=UPI002E1384C0|nr:hypothetical protein [Sphingomonas sp.]
MRFLALLLAAFFVAPFAAAKDRSVHMRPVTPETLSSVSSDKAYILFRTHRPKSVHSHEPIFLRVPTDAEVSEYLAAKEKAFQDWKPKWVENYNKAKMKGDKDRESSFSGVWAKPTIENLFLYWLDGSNVEHIPHKNLIAQDGVDRTYLVEVPAAQYVLYGVTLGAGFESGLHVCFCLGTVGFEAKLGEIVDLGFLLFDQAKTKSVVPELASETGFGPSSDGFLYLAAGTVRPVRSEDKVPASLLGKKIVAADYQAVGKFFHPGAGLINRLVPVPGILGYDGGKVINVKTGEVAIDRID